MLQVLYVCSESIFHTKKNWKSTLGQSIANLFQNQVRETETENHHLKVAVMEIANSCNRLLGEQHDAAVMFIFV